MSQEKHIIEALLFISDAPLLIDQIKNVLEYLQAQEIRALLDELKKEYDDNCRGIRIAEIAGGFQMVTAGDFASFIKKYYKHRHAERLSGPALETLAIVAYKQPVTRLDIESIRGVNVDGVMKNLLEKDLIRIVGRKEVLGRPFAYGTTKQFMEYFGLSSLEELPKMEEFSSLAPAAESNAKILPPESGLQAPQQVTPLAGADALPTERKE